MGENRELELDQLWYTWSTSGLGGMPMGFRVRAASEGFHDIQSLRYRRVNRFLSYDLPEGASMSEFTPRIAPVSLSFVENGEEHLLIRKVFTGQDAVGRNGVFFTHLIAGLPPEFTAREAIRLWYCPELWVESEQGQSPNDTYLEKIPYSRIRAYLDRSETGFNFAPISEHLQNLLLLILQRGLPPHIRMRGHTTLIAALIYGLTHTLPKALLPNLTFTTYESQEMEKESTIILGTVSWAELQDMARVQIQPGLPAGPIPPDLQHYTITAVNALVYNDTHKLYKLIDEIEQRPQSTVNDLIGLYKRRYRLTPLTLKQMEDAFLHPADNVEELLDPTFQAEAAQLLINNPDYLESHGGQVFQRVQSWLASGSQTKLNQQAYAALAKGIEGTVECIFSAIRTALLQGNMPQNEAVALGALAHAYYNPGIYHRMLTEFAQSQIYIHITSDALWSFHLWLLKCAKLMQPQPTPEHMIPWLHITSWGRLNQILKLDLPSSWEYLAMFEIVTPPREIPRAALGIVQTHEAKFISFMQNLLQQGSLSKKQDYINTVLRLFEAIVRFEEQEHSYPNRARLIVALLNAVPNNPILIESFFSIIPLSSPYQLTVSEFDSVVAGCSPEILAIGGTSSSFMLYLVEYILSLTPGKLNQNTIGLLTQFQRTSNTLPEDTARLVNSWLDINTFLTSKSFDNKKLRQIEPALATLVPLLQKRGQDIWQTFIVEVAPFLTSMIETEYQLQSILNVFEGVHVVAAWNLLNVLAAHAGATLAEDLTRLTPYLLCGIREHARTGRPKEELDKYLQVLFAKASDNTLRDVDRAASTRVWPELVQAEWKGWRGRSRPLRVSDIPTTGKPMRSQRPIPFERQQPTSLPPPAELQKLTLQLPQIQETPVQQQRPPAVPQPSQELPAQQPASNISIPEQAGDTSPRPTLSWKDILFPSRKPPKATGSVVFTATIHDKKYPFTDSQYQQIHLTFTQVLPYWYRLLQERLPEVHAKSLAFESDTIRNLQKELRRLPGTTVSETLVQFMTDDILFIQEFGRLRESEDQYAQRFLQPENHIIARLHEFQEFVGESAYKNLCSNNSEQVIKDALSILIRRRQMMFIMDEKHRDWERWLRRIRRNATIEYPRDTSRQ